jgi:hypothetical protein
MPAAPCEKLFQDLRSSLELNLKRNPQHNFQDDGDADGDEDEALYLDQKYNNNRQRNMGRLVRHCRRPG